MIILNQQGDRAVVLKNVISLDVSAECGGEYAVKANCLDYDTYITLGVYPDVQRAKKVLKDIVVSVDCKHKMYIMPEEDKP